MSFVCKCCYENQPSKAQPAKVVIERYENGNIKKEEEWCRNCAQASKMIAPLLQKTDPCESCNQTGCLTAQYGHREKDNG